MCTFVVSQEHERVLNTLMMMTLCQKKLYPSTVCIIKEYNCCQFCQSNLVQTVQTVQTIYNNNQIEIRRAPETDADIELQ